jgi:hypothetical protein
VPEGAEDCRLLAVCAVEALLCGTREGALVMTFAEYRVLGRLDLSGEFFGLETFDSVFLAVLFEGAVRRSC